MSESAVLRRGRLLLGWCCLATGAGCGGSDGSRSVEDSVLAYLPVQVGNWWVYDEVGGAKPGTIKKEVTEREWFGEQDTFVWNTTQTNSPVTKHGNWTVSSEKISRVRQQRWQTGVLLSSREYDPGFLRLSGDLTRAGVSLVEGHVRKEYGATGTLDEEKPKQYTWLVEATDESVTVPAGTFECLRVRRIDASDGDGKIYWYAKGVGKVREDGDTEQELLADYHVAAQE